MPLNDCNKFKNFSLTSPLTNHFDEGVKGEALPNDRTETPKRPRRRSEVTGQAACCVRIMPAQNSFLSAFAYFFATTRWIYKKYIYLCLQLSVIAPRNAHANVG